MTDIIGILKDMIDTVSGLAERLESLKQDLEATVKDCEQHNDQGHRAAASDLEREVTHRRRLRCTVLFAGGFDGKDRNQRGSP